MSHAHIDLFTGLGGFTLAAYWAGYKHRYWIVAHTSSTGLAKREGERGE